MIFLPNKRLRQLIGEGWLDESERSPFDILGCCGNQSTSCACRSNRSSHSFLRKENDSLRNQPSFDNFPISFPLLSLPLTSPSPPSSPPLPSSSHSLNSLFEMRKCDRWMQYLTTNGVMLLKRHLRSRRYSHGNSSTAEVKRSK